MPCVWDDNHLGMGHCVIELKGGLQGRIIVSPVDDGGRDVIEVFGAVQEIVFIGQERLVDEVVDSIRAMASEAYHSSDVESSQLR